MMVLHASMVMEMSLVAAARCRSTRWCSTSSASQPSCQDEKETQIGFQNSILAQATAARTARVQQTTATDLEKGLNARPVGATAGSVQGGVPRQLQQKVNNVTGCQRLDVRPTKAERPVQRLERKRVQLNVLAAKDRAVEERLGMFELLQRAAAHWPSCWKWRIACQRAVRPRPGLAPWPNRSRGENVHTWSDCALAAMRRLLAFLIILNLAMGQSFWLMLCQHMNAALSLALRWRTGMEMWGDESQQQAWWPWEHASREEGQATYSAADAPAALATASPTETKSASSAASISVSCASVDSGSRARNVAQIASLTALADVRMGEKREGGNAF